MSLLLSELDLFPRAFDVCVFSVPFSLPAERLCASTPALAPYPANSLVEGPPPNTRRWVAVANETRRLYAEPADANADMGVAGGLGSGSSLGSRARALPASKYRDSSTSTAPEGGASVSSIFRSKSEGVLRSAPLTAEDIADVARDLSILDAAPGWEGELLTGLPGLLPGPHPTVVVANEGWLLDCPFTRLMVGEGGTFGEGGTSSDGGLASHVAASMGSVGVSSARMSAVTVFEAVAALDGSPPCSIVTAGGRTEGSAARTSARKPPAGGGSGASTSVRVVKSAVGLFDDSDSEEGAAADLDELEELLYENQQPHPQQEMLLPAPTVAPTEVPPSRVAPAASFAGLTSAPSHAPAALLPLLPSAALDVLELGASAVAPAADDSVLLRTLLSHSSLGVAPPAASAGPGLPLLGGPSSSGNGALRWAVTKRMTSDELVRAESRFTPAKTWGFQLDTFQREAIARMETQGSSTALFIAAHTSAGKTIVAEYAIALSIAHRTRCVYTSPIKALSNQKYHDLRKDYGGAEGDRVGIITGDVTVNPNASCLVMTTEILRSMLYRGDEIVNDIEWVIFDEVHYINDEERGVVYEETLMLLPDHVGLIFLSATSPNREEFAEWVGRTKSKPVYVLDTAKRPVPLNHFLFVENALHLLMDGALIDKGDSAGWRVAQYKVAADKLKARMMKRGGAAAFGPTSGSSAGRAGGGATSNDKQAWLALMKMLTAKELLPCIVFSFSKKKCEECAFQGLASVDVTTAREKAAIHHFFSSAVQRLSGTDRTLPQIVRLQGLLKRGIGVHHAGLLPIMKEVVEILFSRGLVKILFATETFAMGVNFPARCVVFNGIRKHDGKVHRDLLPGEYTQMAGRAGRRGLDENGTVIILSWGDVLPDLSRLQVMMTGKPTRLTSQFRLTYGMIINILRLSDLSVTTMMARSYAEFAAQNALGGRSATRLLAHGTKRLTQLQAQLADLPCIRQDSGAPDVEVLDIEETDAVVPRDVLFRNKSAVPEAFKALQIAIEAHIEFLRKLLGSGARVAGQVLCPGRVVVLSEVCVPVVVEGNCGLLPLAEGGSAASASKDVTCYHVPAVVLEVQNRSRALSTSSTPGAATDGGQERLEAWLTVVALLPPCATTESASTRGTGAVAPQTVLPSAPPPLGGMVSVGKKIGRSEDDDLTSMTGGFGKSKSKGGAGAGSKGSKGATSNSAQGTAVVASPISLAELLAASGTPAALLVPDQGVSVGFLKRMPLGGDGALRMVGIVQVRGRALARVTRIVLGSSSSSGGAVTTKAGRGNQTPSVTPVAAASDAVAAAPVKAVLSGIAGSAGGAAALQVLASQLLQQLEMCGGDVTALARGASPRRFQQLGASTLGSLITHLPPLRPRDDLRPPVTDLDIAEAYERSAELQEVVRRSKCDGCSRWPLQWELYSRIAAIETALAAVKRKYSVEALALYPEMRCRLALLRTLGYTQLDDAAPAEVSPGQSPAATLDVVKLKGRVAAEVNTCDELIFTEMIFSGVLGPLSPAECAALLSALVFQERGGGSRDVTPADMAVGDNQSVWQASDVPALAAIRAARRAVIDADEEDDETPAAALATDVESSVAEGAITPTEPYASTEAPSVCESAGDVEAIDTHSGTIIDGHSSVLNLREEILPLASLSDSEQGDASASEASHAAYAGPRITVIPHILVAACDRLNEIAFALGRLQMDAGLDIIPAEYMREKLNYGLLLPTYAWAVGVPFSEICQLTDCAEGTIVRTITRLDETCREVRNAARILGDPVLFRKMEVASACVKRDVIFAGSLYIN